MSNVNTGAVFFNNHKYGSNIIVDGELSKTSTHPVANKVVAEALENVASGKEVSYAEYQSIEHKEGTAYYVPDAPSGGGKIVPDTSMSATSLNVVTNKAITTAINAIDNKLGTQVTYSLSGTTLTITTK